MDADFLFFAFPWFNNIHRIITHNLLFIIIVATAGSRLTVNIKIKAVFLSILAGGILHLLTDSVMDNNPSNGIGVALFWPFSDFMFSPFNILSAELNYLGWDRPCFLLKSLIRNVFIESPFYLAAVIMLYKRKFKK